MLSFLQARDFYVEMKWEFTSWGEFENERVWKDPQTLLLSLLSHRWRILSYLFIDY